VTLDAMHSILQGLIFGILITLMSLIVLTKTEQTSYEYLVQFISRYEYAMDPENREDKSLITDLPKLYSDALETHAAEQGGAINSAITCTLLIAISSNYANMIKDKLATSKFPYISKKYVESTGNWSTWLLEITLQKGFFNIATRVCDGKTPLELACSLMLHKPMMILSRHGVDDLEELYNCLLLCLVNSDVEGFDMIWKKICHVQQCSCEVMRKIIPGTILSKVLRNINLSMLDVAYFHCKRSGMCIMFNHICNELCHGVCEQLGIASIPYHNELINNEWHLSCANSYLNVINSYHGWRTGFAMETDKCQIPSVNIGQLNEEMLELFASIKQPLVIKGVGQDWKLSTKWMRKYLQKHYGAVDVLVCTKL